MRPFPRRRRGAPPGAFPLPNADLTTCPTSPGGFAEPVDPRGARGCRSGMRRRYEA